MSFSLLATDVPWVALSAVVSATVAIATFRLARFTKDLAVETRDLARASVSQFEQAEIHHRQSVSPMVKLSIECEVSHGGTLVVIDVTGQALNAGPGAATAVRGTLRVNGIDRLFEFDVASMINPYSDVNVREQWAIDSGTPSGGFRYGVRYVDIFGDEGWTIQLSPTGDRWDVQILESALPSEQLSQSRKTRDTFHSALSRHLG